MRQTFRSRDGHAVNQALTQATPQLEHLLGVEDLVVGSEQFLNCFLVDLHLGAADPQRAPGANMFAPGVLVGGLDPLDAQGRNGVQVDQGLEFRQIPPDGGRQQRDARGPRADDDRAIADALARSASLAAANGVTAAPAVWRSVPPVRPRGRGFASRRPLSPPAGKAAGPRAGPPARSPPARRSVPLRAIRPGSASAAMTAAAAVVLAPLASNNTDTRNGPKNVFVTFSSTASPAATFEPPMKRAVADEVGRAPREQGPVNQVANVLRRHAAVPEQMLDTRIHGHHAVEDAGLRIGVELDQDLGFHQGGPWNW